jgi:hypothetical protein
MHGFKIPELGKVAPYGVYDIAANQGWVNVGIDAETGAFAVASCLTITADCGGSNGARVKLWKRELQRFANETGLWITVTHLPAGTSKWNKIGVSRTHPRRKEVWSYTRDGAGPPRPAVRCRSQTTAGVMTVPPAATE